MPAAAAPRSLVALRQALDTVVERERTPRDTPALATGIAALDALLPGGGVPRGRLTEVQAPRGHGRTTLLLQMAGQVLAAGRWVAVVDAERTLDPAGWAPLLSRATALLRAGRGLGAMAGAAPTIVGEDDPRLAVIRPRDRAQAAWCADVLVRSGAYALVIVDGIPSLPRSVVLRLTRLAQDRQVCLVIATEGTARSGSALVGASVRLDLDVETMAPPPRPVGDVRRRGGLVLHATDPAAARSETRPGGGRRALRIQLAKGGVPQAVHLPYVMTLPVHLNRHATVPDRRGVARTASRGGQIAARARARRAAEPQFGRSGTATFAACPSTASSGNGARSRS
jgi:recombination protein RecA